MKIFSEREKTRLIIMIGGDAEMRSLAQTILNKKQLIRFNVGTIVFLHCILWLASLTYIVSLHYKYSLGLYWIPASAFSLLQAGWSILYCVGIANFRDKYNETLQKIANA